MVKVKIILQRLLIGLAIFLLVLPASLLLEMVTATKAQAAEPKKTVETTKISKATPATPPILEASKGLSETYSQGQIIEAVFVFPSKEPLKVWAKIGQLDANFPATINLKKERDGAWRLLTPKLTADLRAGRQPLEILAQNSVGTSSYHFSLDLTKQEKTISVKAAVAEKEVTLAWQPVKGTAKYLVEWNIRGSISVLVKVNSESKVNLKNLVPGTFYEIQIAAINAFGDQVAVKKTTLKTLGEAPAPASKVAGATGKTITPAIGSGVATSKVAQKTPETKTESPAPKEENKGGWSRLLVALAILVIAAGAAIGGYYGYEWYAGKGRDQEGSSPTSSSRW